MTVLVDTFPWSVHGIFCHGRLRSDTKCCTWTKKSSTVFLKMFITFSYFHRNSLRMITRNKEWKYFFGFKDMLFPFFSIFWRKRKNWVDTRGWRVEYELKGNMKTSYIKGDDPHCTFFSWWNILLIFCSFSQKFFF